ncbi:MAG: hypothetical protein KDD90_02975 [Sphingomonadaceae bacterium]|nr:hypothetical protein [Sphingomonadaceae bacterium]
MDFRGFLAGALLLAGCANPTGTIEPTTPLAAKDEAAGCSGAGLSVDTAFPSGALSSCEVERSNRVSVLIAPEDEPPINCSPWYAFRLTPAKAGTVTIDLGYTACGHRYWPKYSYDGVTWNSVSAKNVAVSEVDGIDGARIEVASDGRPIFVAAQEIVVPATYDAWLDTLGKKPGVTRFTLGQSAEGRDIEAVRIGNPEAREVIVLVGRQHPPEVTGALAMFPFVEQLLGDDDTARAFRERFQIVAVPLLNPDGVVRGHWRHGTGGMDLNRDWGPFTQPETRLMRDLLEKIDTDPGQKLRLFIDFHSTKYDTIYTLTDAQVTDPVGYKDAWLAAYAALLPGYDVRIEPGHNPQLPVSKAWVYDRFGVPTATYEIGDETDRKLIRQLGTAAAQSMMATMLETPTG